MKKDLIKNILLLILIITTIISINVVSSEDNTEKSLNTTDNYTKALENAKIENKSVVLVFDQKSCSWCEAFKRNTLDNGDVIEELNSNHITVIVNINRNPEVASKYFVYGTPTVIFLDSNGNEIDRKEGYIPPDEFLEKLRGI